MFYGAGCKVCSDTKWKMQRQMMDQVFEPGLALTA
jgi:hypothetical protein